MTYTKTEIGKIVTLRQGFAINKKTNHHMSEEPTNLHLLRIGDMKDGNFSVFVKDTIPEKFIAKESDIIYTRTGQVGLVFRKQHGVVHNNCFTVSSNDNSCLFQNFLFYALQDKEFYEEAISRATGAAQPDLPHGAFNSIQIYLPPIESQYKIVEILDTYNDLIENNQKQIKLLEEAAQRLYKEWFVDLRFPGYEEVEIIDGVPAGWKKSTLEELINVNYGKDHKKAPDDGNIPVYGSGGLMRKCNKSLFNGESVLVPRKGSLNNIMYVNEEFWTVDTMFYTTMKKPHTALFTYFYLRSYDMYAMNIGAAVPSMTVKILNAMDLMIPSDELLEQYDRIAQTFFTKRKILFDHVAKLTEARDRLLPKLMSGEIEV